MTLPLIEASNPSVVPWSSVGNNTLLRPYASAIEKSPDAYQLSHPRGRKNRLYGHVRGEQWQRGWVQCPLANESIEFLAPIRE